MPNELWWVHLEACLQYTPPSLHLNMFAINHLLYLIITLGPILYMSHEINGREKKTVFFKCFRWNISLWIQILSETWVFSWPPPPFLNTTRNLRRHLVGYIKKQNHDKILCILKFPKFFLKPHYSPLMCPGCFLTVCFQLYTNLYLYK